MVDVGTNLPRCKNETPPNEGLELGLGVDYGSDRRLRRKSPRNYIFWGSERGLGLIWIENYNFRISD